MEVAVRRLSLGERFQVFAYMFLTREMICGSAVAAAIGVLIGLWLTPARQASAETRAPSDASRMAEQASPLPDAGPTGPAALPPPPYAPAGPSVDAGASGPSGSPQT
jgi:hypothetical protein